MGHGRDDSGDLHEGHGRQGGRVLSEGEREREGGGEGDVGDGNNARCGRELKARAAHFDERGHGSLPAYSRAQSLGNGEARPTEYGGRNLRNV